MSTRAILVDDIDGVSEATETVRFALDGQTYEIDLSDEHRQEFFQKIHPYASVARRETSTASRGPRSRRSSTSTYVPRQKAVTPPTPPVSEPEPTPVSEPEPPTPPSQDEIRAWARQQKLRVGERGRVSNYVLEAYLAAHRTVA